MNFPAERPAVFPAKQSLGDNFAPAQKLLDLGRSFLQLIGINQLADVKANEVGSLPADHFAEGAIDVVNVARGIGEQHAIRQCIQNLTLVHAEDPLQFGEAI